MVSAYRVPASGGTFDSVRHQQSAVRDAERHHGGPEERDCGDYTRITRCDGGSNPEDRKDLRADKDEEDGVPDGHSQGSSDEAGREIEVRSARDLKVVGFQLSAFSCLYSVGEDADPFQRSSSSLKTDHCQL